MRYLVISADLISSVLGIEVLGGHIWELESEMCAETNVT